MLKDIDIRLTPEEAADERAVLRRAARAAGLSPRAIRAHRVVRRAIDARHRTIMVLLRVRLATGQDSAICPDAEEVTLRDVHQSDRSVVIVGAGPAGLFAALEALELGLRPVVLERGDDVDTRRLRLAQISREGKVDPDCNFSFGEGGAGAYSDGKLYTRSKKRGNIRKVLSLFYKYGAKENILVDAHPHIGTDRLPGIIRNIREDIIAHGGEVHFRTHVDRLLLEGDAVVGVATSDGREFRGPVVLATGHSARDVYRMLRSSGVEMEAKGIAIGCRLEHPQHLIDVLQYHRPDGRGEYLPPAEYNFVAQSGDRGVYSFCMCPGGTIVPAATADGQLVVNGMSSSSRGSRWANSGMVVEVHPGDIPGYASEGPLEMMALQEDLERRFYEEAGETLNAPAQRMKDFVEGRLSADLPAGSYPPGVHSADFNRLLPPFISERLSDGFRCFGRKAPGFLTNEAMLVGLESRTSSPVRVTRDSETLQHIRVKGLYPAGEGAGYAGGIVSAAIDGQRCIQAIVKSEESDRPDLSDSSDLSDQI